LLTVFAVVFSPLGDADAKKKKNRNRRSSPTTLTIDSAAGNQVSGDLTSDAGICVPDRLVRVTRGGANLGADATDENGKWSVPASEPLSGGEQLVATVDKITVKKSKKSKKTKKVTCGADSAQFTVGTDPVDPSGSFALHVEVLGGPDDLGSVTSSPPGINCRDDNQTDGPPVDTGACDASYDDGQSVTLTANPDPDHEFDTWGGDCAAAGTSTACTVTMSQARNVTATFGGGCAPTGTPLDELLCPILELLGA
jgi:hypothetical protein